MIERACIFMAGEHPALAEMCAATVRHHHSAAEIVHLTDAATPELDGADVVWRDDWDGRRETVLMLRMRHLATLDDRPTVLLDSDTLICRSLDDAFDAEFDVGLTWRKNKWSRYNAGVMFSRRGDFWRALLARMEAAPGLQSFDGEQTALGEEAQSEHWLVRDLRCDEWNCPDVLSAELPAARVLHYKGVRRKEKMSAHYALGVWR